MKLRFGFVSNSSSTSYILAVPHHNIRAALFAVFQKYRMEFAPLFIAPYDTVEKVVDALIPFFEPVSHGWLNERKNYQWYPEMKIAFGEAMEKNLSPFYTKLDIVCSPEKELEAFINKLAHLSQHELFIQQVKFP
jgi:hypothetical protein